MSNNEYATFADYVSCDFSLTTEQVDIYFGHDLFWGKVLNSKHSCADPCLYIVVKFDRDEIGT